MTFADLAQGETIFLDANPLVYHFAPDPVFGAACNQLISRIENQELAAFTSTHVLSETVHHLMTIEAANAFGWKSKVVQRLKQQPANVQKLTHFRLAMDKVALFGIQIITIQPSLIGDAARISQQTGLLHNDALIVAVMQQHGLTNLGSADTDFDRVSGLTRYAPT